MAKYSRDGTFFIKAHGGVDVPSNGTRTGVFGKAIPPYVVVEKAWVHVWALGTNGVPMNAKQHLQVSGRMGNMDLDITDDADESSHDTLEEIMARYIPTGIGQEHMDDDQADSTGAGLPAGASGPMSKWAKDRQFYSYECTMGLGKNAMMTEANTLRFAAENSTGARGVNVSGYGCNVQQFRFIGIDISTEVFASDINQAVETHVWGASTANPLLLAQEAFYAFGHQGESSEGSFVGGASGSAFENMASSVDGNVMGIDDPVSLGALSSPFSTNSMLYTWLNTGYGHSETLDMDDADDTGGSGFDDGTPVNVQTAVTLRCKTIKPIQRNIYTPY